MLAEILAVGSELLAPDREETNARWITARLLECGIEVGARITVADDRGLLEDAFRTALRRAHVVIATGGLGPTQDDLTREAAAAALGRALRRDPELIAWLRERFARFGRAMPPVNEQQADVIEGATVVANRRGTAPGQVVEAEGRVLVLLPGPPLEMQPMFEAGVLPLLRARSGGRVLRTRIVRIAAMGESDVEERVAPLYTRFTNPRTTILGGPAQTELHFTAEGATGEEALLRVEELAGLVRNELGDRIFSEDGRELHQVVAELLLERKATLALAESCTGGMVAARLTTIAGASAFLERGYVAYANAAKEDALGVDPALIARAGAVSEEVAASMAEGARVRARTDYAIAITGIAGPGGGTPEKPVGLVFVALAGPAGTRTKRLHLPGDRERVRLQSVQWALEILRRALLGLAPL